VTGWLLSVVSSLMLIGVPNADHKVGGGSAPAHRIAVVQKGSPRVWVNTASGVYHCPGSRYYGATKHGKYLSEQDARDLGYRAAYGRTCASPALAKPTPVIPERLGIAATSSSGSRTKVWVNMKSGVYHCPGTRYYGATKSGTYMSETAARDSAYRPAYGKPCA
jgi:hypothetical protein